MDFLSTTGNFLLILLGFGFLIFVHELGHFLAARWAGIRVDCFAIGMGPPVLAWRRGMGFRAGSTDRELIERLKKPASGMSEYELSAHGLGETEYTLRLLPLGGYVRMVGQEDCNPGAISDSPRSYQSCPIWKRMVVVSAGVVMNLITAVILFWIAFAIGVRFPAPIASLPMTGSPAALAQPTNLASFSPEEQAQIGGPGLRIGDRIIEIDGDAVSTFADIQLAAAMAKPGSTLHLRVARAGLSAPLEFDMVPERDPIIGLLHLGLDGPSQSPTITTVDKSRATVEGMLRSSGFSQLAPGATLTSVNGTSVSTLDELVLAARTGDGATLATSWRLPEAQDAVEVVMKPTPNLSLYLVAADAEASESDDIPVEGLFGLPPLVQVDLPSEGGVNATTLQPGDILLSLGDVNAPNYADLKRLTREAAGKTLPASVLRAGAKVDLVVNVSSKSRLDIIPGPALSLPIIATPILESKVVRKADPANAEDVAKAGPAQRERTPVATLGIPAGARVVQVEGVAVSNWADIRTAARQATAAAKDAETEGSVTLTLLPPGADAAAGAPVHHTVSLSANEVKRLHALGWDTPLPPQIFDPNYVLLKATGPVQAISMGLHETKKMIQQVYLTLDRLIRGSIGIDKLNGPVGIFHIGVKVADQGFTFLIFFIAVISVNLAVMNFLPLPIVDGGLFLFLVYEKIAGKPPSIAFQNAATAVGLLLIGSIFLITFYNDVSRLIG